MLREPGREAQLTPQELLDKGLILVGSPDTVAGQMETLLGQTPVRWLFAWTYNGLVPHEKIMRSL